MPTNVFLICRNLSIRCSDSNFLHLLNPNVESITYEPILPICHHAERYEEGLPRHIRRADMTRLTTLTLKGCTKIPSFHQMHCHSLVELVLLNSCLTEVPACLNTSFPNLQRIHVEDDIPHIYAWEKKYSRNKEVIDARLPNKESAAPFSM